VQEHGGTKMVNRPKISEELKNAVHKAMQEYDAAPKYVSSKNVKHTVQNGCSVFYKEIDNDIMIIKRLNTVLTAFEVEFLLKNSPALKI
jgi:hypothetical protein